MLRLNITLAIASQVLKFKDDLRIAFLDLFQVKVSKILFYCDQLHAKSAMHINEPTIIYFISVMILPELEKT